LTAFSYFIWPITEESVELWASRIVIQVW